MDFAGRSLTGEKLSGASGSSPRRWPRNRKLGRKVAVVSKIKQLLPRLSVVVEVERPWGCPRPYALERFVDRSNALDWLSTVDCPQFSSRPAQRFLGWNCLQANSGS